MSHFQIGWAEYSLTPDKKVSLVGQFAERISEYVEKPLCVTAMAGSTVLLLDSTFMGFKPMAINSWSKRPFFAI